jgi:hypothetical protein
VAVTSFLGKIEDGSKQFSLELLVLMSMSDSDTPEEAGAAIDNGKPKRWAWSETDAYFVNLLIKTCVEIHESGITMNIAFIHAKVMEIWHRRCVFLLTVNQKVLRNLPMCVTTLQIFEHDFASQAIPSSASLRIMEAHCIRRQIGIRFVRSAAFNVGETYCQSPQWRHEAEVSRLCG